jgi:hypothetical protein
VTPRETFIERAERLIARLGERPIHPEIDPDAEYVAERLRLMVRNVREDTMPPRGERYGNLARLAVEQWPWGHELANEVGEVEALYRKL